MNALDYIRTHVSREDLLYQLAEEAAELSQAASKLARKIKGTNHTPKSLSECYDNLVEEVADVELCVNLLGFFEGTTEQRELTIIRRKAARWVARIKKDKRHI